MQKAKPASIELQRPSLNRLFNKKTGGLVKGRPFFYAFLRYRFGKKTSQTDIALSNYLQFVQISFEGTAIQKLKPFRLTTAVFPAKLLDVPPGAVH